MTILRFKNVILVVWWSSFVYISLNYSYISSSFSVFYIDRLHALESVTDLKLTFISTDRLSLSMHHRMIMLVNMTLQKVKVAMYAVAIAADVSICVSTTLCRSSSPGSKGTPHHVDRKMPDTCHGKQSVTINIFTNRPFPAVLQYQWTIIKVWTFLSFRLPKLYCKPNFVTNLSIDLHPLGFPAIVF